MRLLRKLTLASVHISTRLLLHLLNQLAQRPSQQTALVLPPAHTIDLTATQVEVMTTAASLPETTAHPSETRRSEKVTPRSQPQRTALVEGLLDEAWAQGRYTYQQLIDYVKEQTGTGCRRQTIRNWKVRRGLSEAA